MSERNLIAIRDIGDLGLAGLTDTPIIHKFTIWGEITSPTTINHGHNYCLMAMINSSRRSDFSPNCEFVYDRRNKIIEVLVKKEIIK